MFDVQSANIVSSSCATLAGGKPQRLIHLNIHRIIKA